MEQRTDAKLGLISWQKLYAKLYFICVLLVNTTRCSTSIEELNLFKFYPILYIIIFVPKKNVAISKQSVLKHLQLAT